MSADNKKVVSNENLAAFAEALAAKVPLKSDIPTKVSDLQNDLGFTDNPGTITSVTLNGTTTSSGGVDLGYLVVQEGGKGLSSNDYTAVEKNKLGGIDTGAQVNTIESVKVNGTALIPDANKAVDVSVPTALSDLSDDSTHRLVSDTEKTTWSGKQDALTFDTVPTQNSTNPVTSGGLYTVITQNELTAATALNDLNDRVSDLEEVQVPDVDQYPTEDSTNAVSSGGVYKVITDNEYAVSLALSDLNSRISSPDQVPTEDSSNLISSGAVYSAIVENEEVAAAALSSLDSRVSSLEDDLPKNISDLNDDIGIATVSNFVSKTEYEEDSEVVAAAVNELNTRVSDVEDGLDNIVIPTKVSDLLNDSGFTSNTGTLTGVSVNGTAATVSNGVAAITADLGEVNMTSITWSELKALRDGENLVPGMQYRITDYTCTTVQRNTQSAGHVFDIIVIADSSNKLNENARAALHSGDTYFSESKLEAWSLKYCIDNDSDRFLWAKVPRSIGFHYIGGYDDYFYTGNSVNVGGTDYYEFKASSSDNTVYCESLSLEDGDKLYSYYNGGVTELYDTVADIIQEVTEYGKGVVWWMKDEHNNECSYDFKNIMFKQIEDNQISNTKENVFYYTFSSVSGTNDATVADHSLNGVYCFGNRIGMCIDENSKKLVLSECVFRNTSATSKCNSNIFGNNCNLCSFGNNCYSNVFGNYCQYNSFGNDSNYNSLGEYSTSIRISGGSYNTFGHNCSGIYNVGSYNYFRNSCRTITFGRGCSGNTFGNYCNNITFGEYCNYNVFENECSSVFFGNYCSYNTIENNCNKILFGDGTNNKKDYYKYIIIEQGNRYIYLNCSGTPTYSNNFQNIRIAQGVNNSYTWKTITDPNVGQTYQTVYQPANSQTISV